MATPLTLVDVRRLLKEINHQVWLDGTIRTGKKTGVAGRLEVVGDRADEALAALDEVEQADDKRLRAILAYIRGEYNKHND